ncbi:MAG: hypothetical protein L7F77_00945 [Candidatus Magnetominusculus sp. LBB02]|nr:hypothetical protein [Candidatus Magnetominusculus sp. LBB02]
MPALQGNSKLPQALAACWIAIIFGVAVYAAEQPVESAKPKAEQSSKAEQPAESAKAKKEQSSKGEPSADTAKGKNPESSKAEAPQESARAKNLELSKREEAVRKDEDRLTALKADVESKISEYEKILKQLESVMAKLKEANNEKMAALVKTYEAMPAENAAKDLESSDEELAATILSKMKSRKAGLVLAAMGQRKAAALTERMSKATKNLPAR